MEEAIVWCNVAMLIVVLLHIRKCVDATYC